MSGLDEQDLYKPEKEYFCYECGGNFNEEDWCEDSQGCVNCCSTCSGESGEWLR